MKSLALIVMLAVSGPLGAAEPQAGGGGLMNLNCMEALNAIEHSWLAGVFSFVSEKDSTAAFADMLARNRKTMSRYLDKLARDMRVAQGITVWDHGVVMQVLGLYASPLADTFRKPAESVQRRLKKFSMAPTLTLAEMTSRRGATR